MADFVELGLEASDKLLEDHWEKIPDSVFHPLQSVRKIRKRPKDKRYPKLNDLERQDKSLPADERRRKSNDYSDDEDRSHYSDGVYSDGEYARTQPRVKGPRTDPYWQEAQRRTRGRDEESAAADYYTPSRSSTYQQRQETPYPIYPPPPTSHTYPHLETSQTYPTRRSRSTHRVDAAPARPSLKKRPSSANRASDRPFSTSDRGLGAGGIGALAGGFMAQEFGRKKGKGDPMALTLIGAVVGGLGANYVEKRMEKKKDRDGSSRRGMERAERRRDSESLKDGPMMSKRGTW